MIASSPAADEPRLRLAGAGDLGTIVALTEVAFRPYTELFGAPPVPVTEDYAPRLAAGEIWLMESEGQTAGLVVLEKAADHMRIFSLAVTPTFQGRGLGQRLLRFADAQAAAAGCGEIRLYTNARMERNIALYKAFGYCETGRRNNPLRPGWTIVDMTKTTRSVG